MSESRFEGIPKPWEKYLEEQQIPIRLACKAASGWPLVLSLWYLYRDGRLYCATQADSALIEHLREDPKVAFEVAADRPPYRGIRGQGECRLDRSRGPEVLVELLNKYLGGTDSPLAHKLLSKKETEIALVIRPQRTFVWDYSKRMKNSL